MKHFYHLIFLLFLSTAAFAQDFLPGEILMNNDKIITGNVAVDFATNTVVVEKGEKSFIYHASVIEQITTTNVFHEVKVYKTFVHKSRGLFDRWEQKIFEIVTFGKISLLKRGLDFAMIDDGDGYTMYDWYLLEKNNQLTDVHNFKRDVFHKMETHLEEMESFVDQNQLWNLKNGEHIYQLVSYYNRLSRLDALNAQHDNI